MSSNSLLNNNYVFFFSQTLSLTSVLKLRVFISNFSYYFLNNIITDQIKYKQVKFDNRIFYQINTQINLLIRLIQITILDAKDCIERITSCLDIAPRITLFIIFISDYLLYTFAFFCFFKDNVF